MVNITFERLHDGLDLPVKAHDTDAAFDLCTAIPFLIFPGETVTVRTGLKSVIPYGWCCQIVGRSGLATKGVTPLGGLIDSGYREEWYVILYNSSTMIQRFHAGDRIAQFLVLPVPDVAIVEGPVSVEPGNLRGVGGLGHTGV